MVLGEEQLMTPKAMALKSRTTSMGDPEHAKVKKQTNLLLANDSISSN